MEQLLFEMQSGSGTSDDDSARRVPSGKPTKKEISSKKSSFIFVLSSLYLKNEDIYDFDLFC